MLISCNFLIFNMHLTSTVAAAPSTRTPVQYLLPLYIFDVIQFNFYLDFAQLLLYTFSASILGTWNYICVLAHVLYIHMHMHLNLAIP